MLGVPEVKGAILDLCYANDLLVLGLLSWYLYCYYVLVLLFF